MLVMLYTVHSCTRGFTVSAFCLCLFLCAAFEFFGEGDVVEECPWVVEFRVPRSLEILHSLNHSINFLVANEGEERRVDARSPFGAGRISFFYSV